MITHMITSAPEDTTLCFTDGSCLENPGPCGAGAVIYPPFNKGEIYIKKPVAAFGSILLAELVAIQAVMQHINQHIDKVLTNSKHIHIYSDSQTTVGILTMNWKSDNYHQIIQDIKDLILSAEKKDLSIIINWTPGHTDVEGNEVADRLAKEAAQEAKELSEESNIITNAEVNKNAKISSRFKWQRRWEISETGRHFYEFKPDIDTKPLIDIPNHQSFTIINQLRTGYSRLNEYRYKIGQSETPSCQCGATESVEHFVLYCPNTENERLELLNNLNNTLGITELDIQLLLGYDNHEEMKSWRQDILNEMAVFLEKSDRFTTRVKPTSSPE